MLACWFGVDYDCFQFVDGFAFRSRVLYDSVLLIVSFSFASFVHVLIVSVCVDYGCFCPAYVMLLGLIRSDSCC